MYYNNYNTAGHTAKNHYSKHYKRPVLRSKEGNDEMNTEWNRALAALQAGRMIVLIDDAERENEGDLVMAAEFATTETVNFMTKYARGIICAPMRAADLARLELPQMVAHNTDAHGTAFTVSVDAVDTTTGVSPAERAHTLRLLANPASRPTSFRRPGHVFPLQYREGGVFARRGHTEASLDLLRLAGLRETAVICEITAADGEMMRPNELRRFAAEHDLPVLTVDEVVRYRKQHDVRIRLAAQAELPTAFGDFRIYVYENDLDDRNHLAIVKGDVRGKEGVLTRIHSECLTGDVFGSHRCDCGEQLHAALERIEREGAGVIIYMRQEGRGIGLVNKIKAYTLQEQGLDTVEANVELGFAPDLREYFLSAKIIEDLGIPSIRLLTNNPEKMEELRRYGIRIDARESIIIPPNSHDANYLHTKQVKMGHLLEK